MVNTKSRNHINTYVGMHVRQADRQELQLVTVNPLSLLTFCFLGITLGFSDGVDMMLFTKLTSVFPANIA